jgi:hypothetical protein
MPTSHWCLPFLLLTVLAATGCQDLVNAVFCPPPAAVTLSGSHSEVSGQVRAPRKWVRLAPEQPPVTPLDEVAVAQATVILADALGTRVPGQEPVQPDAGGRYRLIAVPRGYTYQVVATFQTRDDKQAIVRSMARTTEGAVTADVYTATTLVTTDLVKTMDGFSTTFEASRFESAVAIAQKQLTDANVPDLTQPDAVQATIAAMLNFNPELTGHMNQLKQELATRPPVTP